MRQSTPELEQRLTDLERVLWNKFPEKCPHHKASLSFNGNNTMIFCTDCSTEWRNQIVEGEG